MRLLPAVAAIAALASASSLSAQAVAPLDLDSATALPGMWTWSPATDGSEAVFLSSAGLPQIWLHCSRPSRTVSIARPANSAAPFLSVWTTSQARALPASFNPATARSTATVAAADSLLDALAFSRARIAVATGPASPVIAPAWPEIARVVEDCRS
ncbi:hypothetical protein [Sphingomonas sp.]|uniref:hypothetical protein n=1 Tax=Sphingomonas sp. TaxID=28214 RepID=UPI0025F09A28|nr:hypothetical protein [Sphingomonas sp.]